MTSPLIPDGADTQGDAREKPGNRMRPVAVAFALANVAVVALFLGLVALGHVDTGVDLPGLDLGFTATAAPSGR